MGLADSANVPGYLQASRAFTLRGSYRAGFNALDLLSAKDAEAFLEDKLAVIEKAFEYGQEPRKVVIDVILAFGVMMVCAEREDQETLKTIIATPRSDPGFDIDEAIEKDQTKPDVVW